MITFAKPHINHCSSLEINQIETLIVDLSAAVGEGGGVEALDLQADFGSNFLPIGIAHCAPVRGTDHLSKHLDDSADEDGDSDVEMC